MKKVLIAAAMASMLAATSCSKTETTQPQEFNYVADRFADIEVLRYKVPDFENLTLNQKKLVYFLTEAALWGRDILWDQNNSNNLAMRRLLEAVYTNYQGDRNSAEFKAFETYMKQVWFGNGIHHHYSTDKFTPGFSREFLAAQLEALPEGEAPENTAELVEVIFNPTLDAKRVNQDASVDLITSSANNMYAPGVTQAEVEAYYNSIRKPDDLTPISYGLNTRVERGTDGKITENTYKVGGLYSAAIEKIVENLDSARQYAENDAQRQIFGSLLAFYTSGDHAPV
ncbi:MAG: dipeptidyl peptidase 3, partial [Muribaculaceae bacterium]|nr:dipeptidyl peptidase 3 [Muribaculaceae bacterium]